MSIKNVYPVSARTFTLFSNKDDLAYTNIENIYSTAGGDIFFSKENNRQRYVYYEFDLVDAFSGTNQKIDIPLVNKNRNTVKNATLSYVLKDSFGSILNKEEILNSTLVTKQDITGNCLSVDVSAIFNDVDVETYASIIFILTSDAAHADNIALFVAERNLKNIRINMEDFGGASTMSLRGGAVGGESNEPTEVELFINEHYYGWYEDILSMPLNVRDYKKYTVKTNDTVKFVSENFQTSMELPVETAKKFYHKNVEYNQYGSIKNEKTKQAATGYFYTKVIDGRYRVIDPEGYVHTIKNVMFPLPALTSNDAIRITDDVVNAYNTNAWKNKVKKNLLDADFNCYEQYYNLINEGKFTYDGLNVISKFPILDSWAREFGLQGKERMSICNILHPKFKERAHFKVKQIMIKEPQQGANVLAYTLDNEPYFDKDDLITCFYTQDEVLGYRQEAAIAWLKNRLEKENVSGADITDELCAEFLSFEFYVYSKIITDEISAMNDNHMVFTPAMQWFKFSTARGFLGDNENFFKVLNKFYDALALTHYSTYDDFNEGVDSLKLNIPVFLNEFSMKALNKEGFIDALAGPSTATQEDRAKYFEHISCEAIKNRNVIGYTWYQYSDIESPRGTINRGIVDKDGNIYTELYDSMKKINSNTEEIIASV